jgi:hypothetical protein
VNAARLTRGKESLSWRTPTEAETHNQDYSSQTYLQNQVQPNWPTANARDWKDSGPTQGNRQNPNLGTAVVKDAANWPTPRTNDDAAGRPNDGIARVGPSGQRYGINLSDKVLHGQAAPASSSLHGSRQGLWLTPRANEPDSDPNFAARNADRGAHCHGTLSSQAKEMWPTITAHTPDMESNGPNGHQGTYLAGAVKQWNTPTALMPDRTPEQIVAASKRTKGHWGKAMNTGNLTDQMAMQQWATPKTPTGGPETAKRKQELGRTASGGGDLASQASGKLNPRWVETLMGLPIGWTMPSCTSPQTIAPMSCGSLAMELCQRPLSELSEFSLAS